VGGEVLLSNTKKKNLGLVGAPFKYKEEKPWIGLRKHSLSCFTLDKAHWWGIFLR
jgi:hypothetical protein